MYLVCSYKFSLSKTYHLCIHNDIRALSSSNNFYKQAAQTENFFDWITCLGPDKILVWKGVSEAEFCIAHPPGWNHQTVHFQI